jgi:hypothetical protein
MLVQKNIYITYPKGWKKDVFLTKAARDHFLKAGYKIEENWQKTLLDFEKFYDIFENHGRPVKKLSSTQIDEVTKVLDVKFQDKEILTVFPSIFDLYKHYKEDKKFKRISKKFKVIEKLKDLPKFGAPEFFVYKGKEWFMVKLKSKFTDLSIHQKSWIAQANDSGIKAIILNILPKQDKRKT